MTTRIIGLRTYTVVFIVLIALTLITVALSRLELGVLHTWLGLAIASAKALLVVLFFMHVYRSDRLTWLAAASGIFFLAIMVTFTLADYMTRPRPAEQDATGITTTNGLAGGRFMTASQSAARPGVE